MADQAKTDCLERVALDLAQLIAARESKNIPDGDQRAYWLKLVEQCLKVCNRSTAEKALQSQ